ncbi:unnamed protein product (macronuclear) [Paramecium tetraurelia]|uniref:Protein kinase domain-containing protein n=1 Tax=Paramecium tetraurelia TaxID=5888 RepID=A0BWI6_PARTE|nr:uncharacterized protein GSPATT00032755001 [Paramecium tetraurelia]CAK62903.1 unnamed protein product [Paramecium tetraurelia]|eukprot:XP_001430301.1 hypothetical protein (macronuclear) [Paramecium tetraurelia strain d4-2]
MIKNNIRPRASSERLDKLAILENQTKLDWIMKNSQMKELKSDIKMIPKESLSLNIHVPEHEGIATIWADNWFGQKKISQFRGLLIYDNQFCLVLNDCFIEKKKYQSSHQRAYFLKLINPTGQLVLIFSHPLSLKQWNTCIKKYCKRNNFNKKFKVVELICQDFYAIQHKKQKQLFTSQVINLTRIQNYDQAELLDNYLKILRNSSISNYIQTIGVFEDKQMLFIVCKYFKGNSLDQFYNQSKKSYLNQQQIATICVSILVALRSLADEELFHGKISFENIICYCNRKTQFGTYLVNSQYKFYDQNTLFKYIHQTPNYLIAPEIHEGACPSSSTDIYQLGVILGLITFFNYTQPFKMNYYQSYAENLMELIIEQENLITKQKFSQEYPQLFSISQLDLIKKMIQPNPNLRISINDALKHVWLINNKEKKMQKLMAKQMALPSLRTIIEIKDSECDLKKTTNNFSEENIPHIQQVQDPNSLFMLLKQKKKISSETFVDSNDEDENVLNDKIEKLNQQNNLVPSFNDHCFMYPSKFL